MSTLSRAVGRVALGALLLLGARDGAAQVSVTTPLLEGLGTHVCRAANPATPVMNLAVTLNLRGGGGQILATSGLIPLAPGQSAETTFDSTGSDGTLYCEAVANTNTEADHLRVDDIFRDSNGDALAAVRGSRTGSGSIPLASPGLSADTNSRLTCAAVNTDSTAQTVTFNLIDDSGTVTNRSTQSIPANGFGGFSTFSPGASRRCEVVAASSGKANKLRADLYVASPFNTTTQTFGVVTAD